MVTIDGRKNDTMLKWMDSLKLVLTSHCNAHTEIIESTVSIALDKDIQISFPIGIFNFEYGEFKTEAFNNLIYLNFYVDQYDLTHYPQYCASDHRLITLGFREHLQWLTIDEGFTVKLTYGDVAQNLEPYVEFRKYDPITKIFEKRIIYGQQTNQLTIFEMIFSHLRLCHEEIAKINELYI